jgi:predicted alpha/beta-fold hydrolase
LQRHSESITIVSWTKDERLLDTLKGPVRPDAEPQLCQEDTRIQILEDAEAWLVTRDACKETKSLLWMNGLPGAGKSCIANTLVKRLRDKGLPVVYFRFNQNSRADATARAMVRSFVYQLADQFLGPRKVILDALRDDKTMSNLELATSQDILYRSEWRQRNA